MAANMQQYNMMRMQQMGGPGNMNQDIRTRLNPRQLYV